MKNPGPLLRGIILSSAVCEGSADPIGTGDGGITCPSKFRPNFSDRDITPQNPFNKPSISFQFPGNPLTSLRIRNDLRSENARQGFLRPPTDPAAIAKQLVFHNEAPGSPHAVKEDIHEVVPHVTEGNGKFGTNPEQLDPGTEASDAIRREEIQEDPFLQDRKRHEQGLGKLPPHHWFHHGKKSYDEIFLAEFPREASDDAGREKEIPDAIRLEEEATWHGLQASG